MCEVVEKILKREGIIKYNGRLIFPDSTGIFFYVNGERYEGIHEAYKIVDSLKWHKNRAPKNPKNKYSKNKTPNPKL